MSAEWTPELTLNHEELDAQHIELFRRLRDAAVALDATKAAAEEAVAALADAVFVHLADEERLMEETLYPERVRHRAAHKLFVADLMQVRDELAASGATAAVAGWVRERGAEWLRFHIRVNDGPFGVYLARRRRHPAVRHETTPRRRPS
jgi:hemerythrin-like metal-binding protein